MFVITELISVVKWSLTGAGFVKPELVVTECQLSHKNIFTLSGSASVKAVGRTLMKLNPSFIVFHFLAKFHIYSLFAER